MGFYAILGDASLGGRAVERLFGVGACGHEAVEDVVAVGCDYEVGDGEAHALSEPASEDIAEITCGRSWGQRYSFRKTNG